jgi:hypothetical protein
MVFNKTGVIIIIINIKTILKNAYLAF